MRFAIVSAIHVKTLLEALDKGATMKALTRKTGYPAGRVLQYIVEARAEGHTIRAVARGQNQSYEPTYYVRD